MFCCYVTKEGSPGDAVVFVVMLLKRVVQVMLGCFVVMLLKRGVQVMMARCLLLCY